MELLYILIIGWVLDACLGDPAWLPHPVVYFGKWISYGEKQWNQGDNRFQKGRWFALLSILGVLILSTLLFVVCHTISSWLYIVVGGILLFFCLAGKTLIQEVRWVFLALDESLEKGRKQVARIVGRDTQNLTAQEVRAAALETLAENLSDGVIAPLFWFLLLGVPGALTYKMVNTLDSMIGYQNPQYKDFGCVAAKTDDFFNYIPARITALLMTLVSGKALLPLLQFIRKYGRCHASPNSGWPEAALAGILDCRFGGPHDYFGQLFYKPYIGNNPRPLTTQDMKIATRINRMAEIVWVLVLAGLFYGWYQL